MHAGPLLQEPLNLRLPARTCRAAPSIGARIASHAELAPDHPAVIDGGSRLTYAQLDYQANQLAAHLVEAGAAPERCVGVLLERSQEFVVAALAVLKSGAAYLPMDSSIPPDRAA